MHDKNGNPIGISAHEFKTDISHSNDGEMVLSLNKDISEMKFNDQLSNGEILSYSNPHVTTNKQTYLGDAADISINLNNLSYNKENNGNKDKPDISSFPKLNTGPTLTTK